MLDVLVGKSDVLLHLVYKPASHLRKLGIEVISATTIPEIGRDVKGPRVYGRPPNMPPSVTWPSPLEWVEATTGEGQGLLVYTPPVERISVLHARPIPWSFRRSDRPLVVSQDLIVKALLK